MNTKRVKLDKELELVKKLAKCGNSITAKSAALVKTNEQAKQFIADMNEQIECGHKKMVIKCFNFELTEKIIKFVKK
jgi:hypothetical protein